MYTHSFLCYTVCPKQARGWRYHSEFWVGPQAWTCDLQLVAMLGAIKVMIMIIGDLCPAPPPL